MWSTKLPHSEEKLSIPSTSTNHARRLMQWGTLISLVYLTGLGIYAWSVSSLMIEMTPDEFATFLSGAFAPIGFLWLVLGFRQQGDELQNSARALWLQGEELRNSVEQQRQLVEVSREKLAYEVAARMESEAEAERAAQPRLVATKGYRSYSGLQQTHEISVYSGGPTCSDVSVIANGEIVARKAVFQTGERIKFEMSYQRPNDVLPIMLFVQYKDLQEKRRQIHFYIPTIEKGGPGDGRTLGEPDRIGVIENI